MVDQRHVQRNRFVLTDAYLIPGDRSIADIGKNHTVGSGGEICESVPAGGIGDGPDGRRVRSVALHFDGGAEQRRQCAPVHNLTLKFCRARG